MEMAGASQQASMLVSASPLWLDLVMDVLTIRIFRYGHHSSLAYLSPVDFEQQLKF